MSPRRPGPATDHETGATITATRADGPLKGKSIEAEVVEGRPPKVIDVHVDHGSTCRHCLADWLLARRTAPRRPVAATCIQGLRLVRHASGARTR
jgi:hypothetical protein